MDDEWWIIFRRESEEDLWDAVGGSDNIGGTAGGIHGVEGALVACRVALEGGNAAAAASAVQVFSSKPLCVCKTCPLG